jgi:predicted transposase YbfD/YdcC
MVMDDAARGFVEGVKHCFRDVEDPRVQNRSYHLLHDIVTITILAVTCGADDWTDIELFGKARESWLRGFLKLPNGIPSHDTFRRVFGLLNPEQFAAGLFQWTQALHKATGGKLIHIDGKALRRSGRKRSGKSMLHLVTAWAGENSLTLGQVACEEKSNEITAIPELLKLLSLKGCTVTIDAMGCQKEIAAQIRKQQAHFVLALKGNQSGLAKDMQTLFEQGMNTNFAGMKHQVDITKETGHGRIEERAVHVMEIPRDHPRRAEWKDLNTLVVVITRRVIEESEHWESRMYVSSHPPRAKPLGKAVRQHWSIENGQHWILDVAFGEDARRQHDRRGATNLAAVRRLIVSLLAQDKQTRRGTKAKRLKAALDPAYLLSLFQNTKFDA